MRALLRHGQTVTGDGTHPCVPCPTAPPAPPVAVATRPAASAGRPTWHSLPLAALGAHTHPAGMMVVTEAEAAAIRAVYEQSGELSAAVELRRLSPLVTDTAQARACARTIAGWKPLPVPLRSGSGGIRAVAPRGWRVPVLPFATRDSQGRRRTDAPRWAASDR